jgi:AcrR family transcriptional regulator
MPRIGLNTAEVVHGGAIMADEVGIGAVSLTVLAHRLGVKPPALYNHVASLADLRHRIAALAMTEFGDELGIALQGKSGFDALVAMFTAMFDYIRGHPGRYGATVGEEFQGEDDPLFIAGARVVASIAAVLSGYGIPADQIDHAIRTLRCTIHGFALLQAARGFQWSNDPDESFQWMIRFIDAGLRTVGGQPA